MPYECHAELVSASVRGEEPVKARSEILKQVQDDERIDSKLNELKKARPIVVRTGYCILSAQLFTRVIQTYRMTGETGSALWFAKRRYTKKS